MCITCLITMILFSVLFLSWLVMNHEWCIKHIVIVLKRVYFIETVQIPLTGFPVQENIDVQVDFIAPSKPGRYISIWRLLSPSGKNFGHCFWVLIKVLILWRSISSSHTYLKINLQIQTMGH